MPLPFVPPPEATQKVSEMHETEVKPPPGGRVVRGMLHPGMRGAGTGTVVGTAEGVGVVVDVAGTTLVVGRGAGSVARWASVGVAAGRPEHPQPTTASTAAPSASVSRLGATCPLLPGSSCPIGLTDAPEYRPEPGEPGTIGPGTAQPSSATPRPDWTQPSQPSQPSRSTSVRKTIPVRGLGWKKVLFGGIRLPAWAHSAI